jgi:Zn-dependent protease with chaperone function
MDFFVQQDKARSKTGMLVALFIFAILLVIIAVYAAIMGVILYNSTDPDIRFLDPRLFLTIAGVTFGVICIGSIIKIAALSKGGSYVAESLGGILVSRSTQDPDQRKLINVVEEMAIASGTPVPPVYLLENEKGINAFAAGFSTNDVVIGVTEGCCQRLTREELQGVIAHEFSHILNGDMRLNIRLMGFLGGIMVISTIGNTILRGTSHRSRSSGKTEKGGGNQILIIAILLLIIGYIGVLISRLIQSAVSRQREYLADASAVQFTRSTGIAGALKKIGGFAAGSKIESPAAGEACHMFFGKAVSSLFATHPPLVDRIQKIEPGFKGDFSAMQTVPTATDAKEWLQSLSSFKAGQDISVDTETVMNQIGNITPENVAYSAAILAAIPDTIKNEIQDILGASAVVCALLLDGNPAEKKKQMALLSRSATPMLLRQLELVDKSVQNLAPELKLPVLDLSLPTLRQMSPEQFAIFQNHLQLLMEADQKVTIFEFSLKEIISHRLEAAFNRAAPKILYRNITQLAENAVALLAALSQAGQKGKEAAGEAFRSAISVLPIREKNMELPEKVSFHALHEALERFSQASPGVRKTMFDSCCQTVLFDGKVSVHEAELLRAIAYAVDIPVPPFMAKASD